jgi:hypothetical protein
MLTQVLFAPPAISGGLFHRNRSDSHCGFRYRNQSSAFQKYSEGTIFYVIQTHNLADGDNYALILVILSAPKAKPKIGSEKLRENSRPQKMPVGNRV